MYFLRALTIFIFLFSTAVFSKVKSVSLTAESSSYDPKPAALTLEEKLSNNIKSTSLAINEIQMTDNWKASVTASTNVADYSRYLLYDTTATNSVSLGSHITESNVSLDQVINFGSHIFEVIAGSNFGTTPLRKTNASIAYLKKISSTNTMSITFGFQKQNVPQNYFQNPNNNNTPEARPTDLDTQNLDFSWDHIYTENYKNRIELSLGQRVQDRPAHYGLGLKNLYVLNETMALRADIGYLTENRSEKLKSDLGYQTSTWIETKFINSVNTYVNYGLGYSVEINQEYRPWSNSTEQLGNDQILLDLNYDASKYTVNFSAAFVKYNTGQTGTNLKAGILWNL